MYRGPLGANQRRPERRRQVDLVLIGAVVALEAVELRQGDVEPCGDYPLALTSAASIKASMTQNAGPSSPPITILSRTRTPRLCGGAPLLVCVVRRMSARASLVVAVSCSGADPLARVSSSGPPHWRAHD